MDIFSPYRYLQEMLCADIKKFEFCFTVEATRVLENEMNKRKETAKSKRSWKVALRIFLRGNISIDDHFNDGGGQWTKGLARK